MCVFTTIQFATGIPFYEMTTSNSEDPYAFLTSFDKIFVIDDNGNMVGRSWQEFQSSLLPTTSTCTVHDAEDVGIDSLNHQSPYTAVQSPENILGCSNLDLSFTSPEPGEGIFIEEDEQDWPSPSIVFKEANKLAAECDAITTRRYSDANFLPYLNVRLSFEKSISQKYLQEPGSVSYVTSWLLHSLTGTDNKLWDKWNRRNGEHTLKASFEKNCYQRIPWSGSSEGGGIGPETDWHSSDVPWKKGIDGNRTTQQGYCSHIPLLFMVPKQFLCLAILASIIVPVISADTPFYYVDAAAWAFAILANVPSLYVLANPTLLPGGNGHAEDIIWKVARGWYYNPLPL